MSIHRGTKEFAAECPECGKSFNDKGYLSSHMKIHRWVDLLIILKSSLKTMKLSETKKNIFVLTVQNRSINVLLSVSSFRYFCWSQSSNKINYLDMHVRIHLGLKPHICTQCGKQFSRKMLLKQHHRTHVRENAVGFLYNFIDNFLIMFRAAKNLTNANMLDAKNVLLTDQIWFYTTGYTVE